MLEGRGECTDWAGQIKGGGGGGEEVSVRVMKIGGAGSQNYIVGLIYIGAYGR